MRRALTLLVAATVVSGLCASRASALAGDRLVNPATGTDSGTCTVTKCKTITYALGQAVAGNRIVLDAGNYTESPKPVINKAVTIEGAGAATTLIGSLAPSAGAALTVTVGAANAVTINGVTIRNGVGGLFVNTGSATVNNSTITNNTGTAFGAGVIVNTAANAPAVTLNNTTVSSNTANNGGGIYTLGGTVTMTGGQVVNNTANAVSGNTSTGFGGGIYNASTGAPAGLTLTNVTVSGNKAVAAGTQPATGGGVYNNGTANISGSSLTNNQAVSATNTAGNGGGLYNAGTLNASSATVSNNVATVGGGIYNIGQLTVGTSTIGSNAANPAGTAVGGGGGLFNTGTASVIGTSTLTDTTVTQNTGRNGGGVMNFSLQAVGSKVVMTGGHVTNNTASALAGNTNTGFGGGIYNVAAGTPSLSLTSTDVSANTGTNGAGVYNASAASLNGASISGNTAVPSGSVAGSGGGIYNAGALTMNDGAVANNTANPSGTVAGLGGGLYNTGTATVAGVATIGGTSVTGNTANDGGGIINLSFLAAGSRVAMTGGEISGNTANAITGTTNTGFGGGVYSLAVGTPALSLSGVAVKNNKAVPSGSTAGTGGGVYNATAASIAGSSAVDGNSATNGGGVYNAGTLTASDSSLTNNTATNGGGSYTTGTQNAAGSTTLTNMTVTGNAANNGGGLLNFSVFAPGSKLAASGGNITDNTATAIANTTNTGFGGGIYNVSTGSPSLSLDGVNVTANKALATTGAAGTGGGVYNGSPGDVKNTRISDNSASNGGGIYNTNALTLSSSTISGNSAVATTGITSGIGGGLYNVGNNNAATNLGVVVADATNITGNAAADGAGLFNTGGKVATTGGGISDNTVTALAGAANSGFGGGVYTFSGISPGLVVSGTKIERNSAVTGGSGSSTVLGNGAGIYNFGFSTISSPSFADNTASGSGGAIYNGAGTIDVIDTPLTHNFASFLGGTIYDNAGSVSDARTSSLVDSPITGTGNKTFVGGGVAIGANAKFVTTGGEITGNRAVSAGGLYVPDGGQAVLDHTPVTDNVADGGFGGGIFNGGTTSVSDSEISANVAIPDPNSSTQTGVGGGIYSASNAAPTAPRLTLIRDTLAENEAFSSSALVSTGSATIRTSTLTKNVAAPSYGTIVSSGPLSLVDDTINKNSGGSGIGGVVQFGSTPVGYAGTVNATNGSTNCFGPIADGGRNLTDTTGSGSCVFTKDAVIGDPKLGDLADNGGPTRTKLPTNASPVINKIDLDTATGINDAVSGDPVTLCPSGGATDQRGIAEPQGQRCDIGSVELTGIVAPTLQGPDHAQFVIGTPNAVGFTYAGVGQPTVTISGDALPSGVTFVDHGDGTASLSGTAAPGTAGVYHFTITAANGEEPAATIAFTLTVIEPLVITTNTLPEGTPGKPYSATLAASGGTTPYSWTLDSGQLPPGVSLSNNGTLTGTPTTRGIYTFVVRVTDSSEQAQSTTKQFTIAVRADTALKAEPAVLKFAPGTLRISVITVQARLTEKPSNAPVAGQVVHFFVDTWEACSGVTDSNGVAKCSDTTVEVTLNVLLNLGYDAVFDGNETLRASHGHGTIASVGL